MHSIQPSFSIIVSTYNRPRQLNNCLQSLASLNYPRDCFEVIVVHDGDDLFTQPIVEEPQYQMNVTKVRQKNGGPASARNTGAANATGQYLVFTDDDCTLAPDYLTKLETRFREAPYSMIGGRTINTLTNNLYAITSQLLVDYFYQYYNKIPEQSCFFASNNLALPAGDFENLGGFDTSFPLAAGEDRELCHRWLTAGRGMFYAPELIVYHTHQMNLSHFWRQHFNYGRGAFHFHRMRDEDQRGTPEPFSFYLNLLCYPLTQDLKWQTWLLVDLLFVAQVANTLGFFWEVQKKTQIASINRWKTVK
ncbi:glycosyltransferase [Chloroflexi bacterium TSY]|nr:glycosyltransferase [Chloroflexi bacterium TSY]